MASTQGLLVMLETLKEGRLVEVQDLQEEALVERGACLLEVVEAL